MNAQTNAKRGAQKNVHAILAEKVLEHLQRGVVPWLVPWMSGGLPENLVSKHSYRGANRMLLACLGYGRNLFLTSKQLKELDGAILPEERPHTVFYLSEGNGSGEPEDGITEGIEAKKRMQLKYYTVFNIAQCKWPEGMTFPEVEPQLDPIQISVPMKSKDNKRSYYDPLEDFINLPNEKHFANKQQYCWAHFHQLMHSTGHHSRLNRRDLIQMSEFGYDAFSHEELVADIGAAYLMFHHDMTIDYVPTGEYIAGWIRKFSSDPYLPHSAALQAEKAINFIFIGELDRVAAV